MSTEADCLFCRIVAGEIPATIVHEGEKVIAFEDINPEAPLHLLVIPKAHHRNVGALADSDAEALAELVQVGAQLAAAHHGPDSDLPGFRLVFNTDAAANQTVFHVHGHILAGRSLQWPPG